MVVIPPEAVSRIHASIVDESVGWSIIQNRVELGMRIINGSFSLEDQKAIRNTRHLNSWVDSHSNDYPETNPHTWAGEPH